MKWKVEYRVWIPSYRDFDYDCIVVEAETAEQAIAEAGKRVPFIDANKIWATQVTE